MGLYRNTFWKTQTVVRALEECVHLEHPENANGFVDKSRFERINY
jgi:hypothetical protein